MVAVFKRISDTILGTSITKPGYLVKCFTPLYRIPHAPIFYKFESYPIHKLITKSDPLVLKPDGQFTWWEEMDETYKDLLKSDIKYDALIYVLSSPTDTYPIENPFFEVYDPLKDEWTSLPDPPFRMLDDEVDRIGLLYVVIGAKLYVTSHRCSCIYDTKLQKWEACDLFSDFYPSTDFNLSARSGPPFPFMENPILCKHKFLLVPGLHHLDHILAFHITDKNIAVEIPFEFNSALHCGYTMDPIVDLGDDYFAVTLYGFGYMGFVSQNDIESDDSLFDVSMATFKLQVETRNTGFFLKGTIMSIYKVRETRRITCADDEFMGLRGDFVLR